MGSDRYDGDDDREISSKDHKKDCRNDKEEGRQRGMGVIIGGHGIKRYKVLANRGVSEEAPEKNWSM